jgi:isoleucyl-tRNA synthetase
MVAFEPTKFEPEILKFWKKRKIYEKQKKLYENSTKRWSFIDGPITASNISGMGLHHAWGRTLKDIYLRWHAVRGYNIRRQNGFDTQGLWIEREIEKALNFTKGKEDIEKYGIDKFVEKCKEHIEKVAKKITEQSIRLAQWMDWDNSYFTHTDKANEYKWHFLKFCHDKGWIYKGKDVIPWCPRCATAESKHAIATEGYFEVEHISMFMQFPLKGKKNEFFLVWTTTPWTVPSDVALAVNPNLNYVKVKQNNNYFWLAESRLSVLQGKYEVIEKKPGKELVGLTYEMPYKDLEAQKGVSHRVVAWELVSGEDGTGIVHIAPGCGPEDYQLGIKEKLSSLSPLNEEGKFLPGYDWLVGKHVTQANVEILEDLQKRGYIYNLEKIAHRYPHCSRCHTELVFRLVDEWYISVAEIRQKLIEENRKIRWVPSQGQIYEEDWLKNMGDWLISRKRYYGLPLPIWECSCGNFEVIGSIAELKEKAVSGFSKLKELHRPWVDAVKIKCSKCGKIINRIPDTGDVWLDAGMVPFFTLDYLTNKKYFDKWYPADFVTECGPGQYRCWFYSMLLHGVVLTGKAPFKSIMTNELVKDEKGKEMHKSWGNAIWFDEAVEKVGADILRWRYSLQDIGKELWFGWKGLEEPRKSLLVLWNLGNYLQIHFSKNFKPKPLQIQELSAIDKWFLSKLESLKLKVDANLDALQPHLAALALQDFFLNTFSREYVHYVRDILSEDSIEKENVLQVLYKAMLDLLILLAPFIPFTTEKIYQDVLKPFQKEESIHLFRWPDVDKNLINPQLEEEINLAKEVLSNILALREKIPRSIKWPIKSVTLVTKNKELVSAVQKHKNLLQSVANVLNIEILNEFKGVKYKVKADFSKVGPKFEKNAAEIVAKIAAMSPESILRALRKDNKLILELGKEKVELEPEDLIIEETLPPGVMGATFGNYSLYLELEETQEMLQLGFVREFIRAVQALRKSANLQRTDKIALVIAAPASSQIALQTHLKDITKKVGASSIDFTTPRALESKKYKNKLSTRNFEAYFGF